MKKLFPICLLIIIGCGGNSPTESTSNLTQPELNGHIMIEFHNNGVNPDPNSHDAIEVRDVYNEKVDNGEILHSKMNLEYANQIYGNNFSVWEGQRKTFSFLTSNNISIYGNNPSDEQVEKLFQGILKSINIMFWTDTGNIILSNGVFDRDGISMELIYGQSSTTSVFVPEWGQICL